MGAWQKIICKTPHFSRFSVIFVCFLTLWVGFYHISLFFFHFWLFCSHSPTKFAHWQNSLAEKLRTAEQNRRTWPPLTGKNVGRKGLNFGRMGWLAPLWKWSSYAYEKLSLRMSGTCYTNFIVSSRQGSLSRSWTRNRPSSLVSNSTCTGWKVTACVATVCPQSQRCGGGRCR